MGIDNNEVFDVRFENSALKIEPNPEAGHYTLTDTTMFKDCEFNLNWGFSSTPWIPEDQWRFLPDSVSLLFSKAKATAISPLLDLGGTGRSTTATIGALERP
jgi:hypothetical protein